MHRYCMVSFANGEKPPQVYTLDLLPDLMRTIPEGLCRSTFFFDEASAEFAQALAMKGALALSGPFSITHRVRKALDIVLDKVGYSDLNLQIEISGKRTKDLPPPNEMEILVAQNQAVILIDNKPVQPFQEVYGFPRVHLDTLRTVQSLRALGVPQEAMQFQGTTDEITIEIHPGIFGLPEDQNLSRAYMALLFHTTGVQRTEAKMVRTGNKTVVLDHLGFFGNPILLPGSIHPELQRPKVLLSASHIAFGKEAVSDFCCRNRTPEDCIQELETWLKFLQKPLSPIDALRAKITTILSTKTAEFTGPDPSKAPAGTSTESAPEDIPFVLAVAAPAPPPTPEKKVVLPSRPPAVPQTPPLKQVLSQNPAQALSPSMIKTAFAELNKCLGGGWLHGGVHAVVGPNRLANTGFLLHHAWQAAAQIPVWWVSPRHHTVEVLNHFLQWWQREPFHWPADGEAPPMDSASLTPTEAMKAFTAELPSKLHLLGRETGHSLSDMESISRLASAIGSERPAILVLDDLDPRVLDPESDLMAHLRKILLPQTGAILLSFTSPIIANGGSDPFLEWHRATLERWQGQFESLLALSAHKDHLKRFLALAQGKVNPAIEEKCVERLYQIAGGKKHPEDTFVLAQILYQWQNRPRRILYLYQPESLRFYEGPSSAGL